MTFGIMIIGLGSAGFTLLMAKSQLHCVGMKALVGNTDKLLESKEVAH